eukprot:scaffold25750_cov146-Isochrysis_galbana.AAC.8
MISATSLINNNGRAPAPQQHATMPATAGRVRMPANNRMQTSASLNTHGIWQNAIGLAALPRHFRATTTAGQAALTLEYGLAAAALSLLGGQPLTARHLMIAQ